MSFLEVIARKEFFSKSLTGRLQPFIYGNMINAKNVEVPSGRFCIEISIADANGERTVQRFALNVFDC